MKTHPRNKTVRSIEHFQDRFIFGDAVPRHNYEPYECLVHTAHPAFCCRMINDDQTPFFGCEQDRFASSMLYDQENNASHYVCNSGIRLFDFYFYNNETPSAFELKKICDDAIEAYNHLNLSYEQSENLENKTYVWKKTYIKTEDINKQIKELINQANISLNKDQNELNKLKTQIDKALSSGNQEIFNEAQLSLADKPEARNLLINCASELIAHKTPDKNENISYDLWSFPLIFSRKTAGVWWHHPRLKLLEEALIKTLHIDSEYLPKISTNFFTFEMLKECACQPLIKLSEVIYSGQDFALYEPKLSQIKFAAENQINETQLMLCWIPFLLPAKLITQEKVHQLANDVLNAALPIVQSALGEKMSYVDAELFAPLPWWQSLDAAIKVINNRRVDLVLSMLLSQGQEIKSIKAIAVYRPDNLAYQINIFNETDDNIAQVFWLLVPNLAPDRALALRDLESFMKKSGITQFECKANILH